MSEKLIEIEQARRRVLEHAAPLGTEQVELADAVGRVLGEAVTSADDVPGFDNSAMDGYAVIAADTAGASESSPVSLEVVDESRAGHPSSRALAQGEAIAISTGAVVPAGADAVVAVEQTDGGHVRAAIATTVKPGTNVRRAGEDIAAGETVIAAGTPIGAAEAGVLASIGIARIDCARRPRVSVLTTGDELQEPGEPLRAGSIRNSNAYSVAALVVAAGAELEPAGIVRDDRRETIDALGRALGADVTVICGGVSVGEHDHVRPALLELGVEEIFWRVALRPGKPTYFGVRPPPGSSASRPVSAARGRNGASLVFGLPGNPVSAMVTFLLFARPAIRAMLGAGDRPRISSAILDHDYPKRPGRAHLVRCRLELREDGWHAEPTKEQGSHVLTSMLGADALAVIPTSSAGVAAGERVEIELIG